MIATLAQFALSLAMTLCAVGAWCEFRAVGRAVGNLPAFEGVAIFAKRIASVVFLLCLVAFACLIYSFLIHDFSVRNVAENSNVNLAWYYRLAASWGSHEGSFLLWVLMFSGWMWAVAISGFEVSNSFKIRVLATLKLVLIGFLLYLLTASNPFEFLSPTPIDGRDLNPLLQDIIMIIHPPMLYMGYVGFAVAFAFAIAGLLEGRFDVTWARWSRPWANVAWAFLTIGIALGSWWAYRELGWGGWWFWDPVENASLMPWLSGTALIHSLAVTEKRGVLRSWTILLALTSFALSLLGTFLVRSGVLTSVHAFATDPERGVFILALLFIIVGVSYVLFAMRAGDVGQGGGFTVSGRESLLLSNNVLMSAALVTVMLGTLYPLVVEVITGNKMSVGQPYFEAVFAPILLPALFIMALGPDSRWHSTPAGRFFKPGSLALVAALALVGLSVWWFEHFSWLWATGALAALFLAVATAYHAWLALAKAGRAIPESGLLWRAKRLGLSYWAMVLAHIGVAVFVVGVTWVKTFEVETDAMLKPGESANIGNHTVTFLGVDSIERKNHIAAVGVFEITKGDGNVIYLLQPEKRRYSSTQQVMTEAAIHHDGFSDVYVSLGEASTAQNGAWGVRLYSKPLINLIWLGCALMALGGFITVWDKRYRSRRGGRHGS